MMPVDISRHLTDAEELRWYKFIKDYEGSGLSRKAYCNANRVDYRRFLKWYRKLIKKEGDILKRRCNNRMKLAPVKLKQESQVQTKKTIRLELENKLNLHIPVGFNQDTLKKILEVVSSC